MAETGGLPPEVARGVVGTAVTAIGGFVAWMFRRRDVSKRGREAKLDAWHDELSEMQKRLDEGRTAYVEKLEERLAEIEKKEKDRDRKDMVRDDQLRALRFAFELVSTALRAIDAHNPALSLAEDLMRAAFPVPTDMPAPVADPIRRLGATNI